MALGLRRYQSAIGPIQGHSLAARCQAATVSCTRAVADTSDQGEGLPCQPAGNDIQPNSDTQIALLPSPLAAMIVCSCNGRSKVKSALCGNTARGKSVL